MVDPLAGDALELTEQVELGVLVGVTVPGLQKVLRQVVQHGAAPQLVRVNERQVDALTDDRLVLRDRGADQIPRQGHRGIRVEVGCQPLLGQFDLVAQHARESDLAGVALRCDGLDLHGWPGFLDVGDHRLPCEVEWDAENVRVLDVEEPGLLVRVV